MAGKPAARVQVRGGAQFRRAMKMAGAEMSDLTDLHKVIGRIVLNRAHDKVPRDTGALDRSQKAKATRTSARVEAGSNAVPYAGPIHFGWGARNIEPQPWLYDALDDRQREVVERYESEVEQLVRKIDAMTPDR